MIAYLDSSVLLRIVLGQPNPLEEWDDITSGVASNLVRVECLRTLDRLRLRAGLSDQELAERRRTVFRFADAMEMVEVAEPILDRAAQPFPTSLGTLDAIHLATAMAWRDARRSSIAFATHDRALGTAAAASGLEVLGTDI